VAKIADLLSQQSRAALEGLDLPPISRNELARMRVASSRKASQYHENAATTVTLQLRRDFRRSLERDFDIVN
jgi:hypothetical protein